MAELASAVNARLLPEADHALAGSASWSFFIVLFVFFVVSLFFVVRRGHTPARSSLSCWNAWSRR
jgi:hypothetical protein